MKLKEYISFAVANFANGTMGTMVGGYLWQFYSSIGISDRVTSRILAVTRIWDSINDPIAATIIDNGRSPKGKFTPYMKLGPLVSLMTIPMFIKPPFTGFWPVVIWCVAAYTLWETTGTFFGTAFSAMQTVMSRDQQERSNYITIGNLGGKLSGAVPGLIPVALEVLTKYMPRSRFYTLAAVLFGVIGGAAALFGLNLKERVQPPKQQQHFWESFVTFLKNKQLILLWTANISNIVGCISWAANQFFFIHSLGNYGYQTLIWTLTGIPGFIAMTIAPFFTKRFRPSRIVIFANLLGAGCMFATWLAGSAVGYATPLGIALTIGFALISALPGSVRDVAANICSVNTYDWCEWETGKRAEATSMVATGMLNKWIDALGKLAAGAALAFIKFDGRDGVVQTQTTKDGLFFLFAIPQGVAQLISALPYFFFRAEGREFDRVRAQLEERRKAVLETQPETAVV